MLNYTNAQFNHRMLTTPEGECVTCGGPAERDSEYDAETGTWSGGYSHTCLRCFGLFHDGKAIGHSHMFGDYPDQPLRNGQRYAWPTTVDMRPAFVAGAHVGWFCAGGHADQPCEWNLTNAEAQAYLTS
jgi:hypothetical protein